MGKLTVLNVGPDGPEPRRACFIDIRDHRIFIVFIYRA